MKAEATIREFRRKYAEGKLSPRMIAKLEAIPGWDWEDEQPVFKNDKDIEAFIAYQRKRHAEGTRSAEALLGRRACVTLAVFGSAQNDCEHLTCSPSMK